MDCVQIDYLLGLYLKSGLQQRHRVFFEIMKHSQVAAIVMMSKGLNTGFCKLLYNYDLVIYVKCWYNNPNNIHTKWHLHIKYFVVEIQFAIVYIYVPKFFPVIHLLPSVY